MRTLPLEKVLTLWGFVVFSTLLPSCIQQNRFVDSELTPTATHTATRGLTPIHIQNSLPKGRIAFVSDRAGDKEIYVINPDGTGLYNLTNNPAHDYWPTWSPDGSSIAFESDGDGKGEIYYELGRNKPTQADTK